MSAIEAQGKARAAGTPDSALDTVQSKEFLLRCLRKAKLDTDLIQDVADAVELNELDALVLGSGMLTPDQAADQLFLMQDEATRVLGICKRQCMRHGVKFEGETYEFSPEDEWDADPPPAPLPVVKPAAHKSPEAKRRSSGGFSKELRDSWDGGVRKSPGPVRRPSLEGRRSSHDGLHAAPSKDNHMLEDQIPEEPAVLAPAQQTTAAAPVAAPAVERKNSIPAAAAKHASAHASHATPVAAPAKPAHSYTSASATTTPQPAASSSSKPAHSTSKPAPTPRSVKPAISVPRPIGTSLTLHDAATSSSQPAAQSTPVSQPSARARPVSAPAAKPTPSAKSTPSAPDAKTPAQEDKAPSTARGSSIQKKTRPASAATPKSSTPKPETPVPSYARPTAAFKAAVQTRIAHEAGEDAASAAAQALGMPQSTPSPVIAPPVTRRSYAFGGSAKLTPAQAGAGKEGDGEKREQKNVFAKISASLLRPTKAFLAWTKGNEKKTDSPDKTPQFKARPLPKYMTHSTSKSQADDGAAISDGPSASNATEAGAASPSVSSSSRPGTSRSEARERHLRAQEAVAKKKAEERKARHTTDPVTPNSGIPRATGSASAGGAAPRSGIPKAPGTSQPGTPFPAGDGLPATPEPAVQQVAEAADAVAV